jgi:hypothetical protein
MTLQKPYILNKLDTINTQLADIMTLNDHSVAYVYNADGSVQSTTEKDANR